MANFCIPKPIAEKIKQAIKAGTFSITEIDEKSSLARKKFFQDAGSSEELATEINSSLERAIFDKDVNALMIWVKENIKSPERKSQMLKRLEDVKKELEQGDLFTDINSLRQDLIKDKLGITVSAEEAGKIIKLSDNLEKTTLPDNTGKIKTNPKIDGLPSDDYFKALKELNDYTNSLNPTPLQKVFTGSLARTNLLFQTKSSLLNLVSNTVRGVESAVVRRMASGRINGYSNNRIIQYVKEAGRIFDTYGFDVTRLSDPSLLTARLGEDVTHSKGKGMVRAWSRFNENVVFNKLLQAPDVRFAAFARADRANIESTLLAKRIGKANNLSETEIEKMAKDIFEDSLSATPQNKNGLGVIVSEMSIADAAYATFQNNSILAASSQKIRDALNKLGEPLDLEIGTAMMPFSKTPSNVIEAGLDSAGLGYLKATFRVINAVRTGNPNKIKGIAQDVARSSLGLGSAVLIANAIKSEDYIGSYPTNEKERRLLEAKKAKPNSIKIGDKWYSLDYFGSFAAPLVGILTAKKYGNEGGGLLQYVKGAGVQALQVPGFEYIQDAYKGFQEFFEDKESATKEEVKNVIVNNMIDFARSRLTPGIWLDVVKGIDEYERDTGKKVAGKDPYAKLKLAIPGLRETLPEKRTVFQEKIKSEGLIFNILSGARVSTSIDTPITRELSKLEKEGELPTLTHPDRSSRVQTLKKQLTDSKYQNFLDEYGQEYQLRLRDMLSSLDYEKSNLDEKINMWNEIKAETLTEYLDIYGYDEEYGQE